MRFKNAGNKRDSAIVVIRNAEASATMAIGAPVMYQLSSTADDTYDGVDVVNPSTIGTIGYQLGAGVNITPLLAAGQYGESLVYGYSQFTLLKLQSRATSTDSWSSAAAIASNVLLVPDFTNNVWQSAANVAAQSSPQAILLDAVASLATLASNLGVGGGSGADTRTVSNGLKRAFIRMF